MTDAIAAPPVRPVAFDPIGDDRLKGFKTPTALFVARRRAGSGAG